MEIIIDTRETKLKDYFQTKDNVTIKALDIGDIIFKYNDDIVLVIERKTLSDLASSIKDGRYKEQKIRLISNVPRNKIVYIIEGCLSKHPNTIIGGLPVYTLFSSLINTMMRDQIMIYKTKNIKETIRFIKNFTKKLEKQGISFLNKQCLETQFEKSCIKKKKKNNMTPEICFLSQLSQIPGISYNIAKIIFLYCSSLICLILLNVSILIFPNLGKYNLSEN